MPWDTKFRWVYSAVVAAAVIVVIVVFVWAFVSVLTPPAAAHIIHSGIGNALCTPSNVCTRSY